MEIAYPQPVAILTSPDYSSFQTYLYPSSALYPNYLGINAKYAWENKNIRGEGVRLLDLGMGWYLDHEDLLLPSSIVFGTMSNEAPQIHHGTSTIGEIVAHHNGFGVSGIAPNVDLRLVSLHSYNTPDAITTADNNSRYGDIISFEIGSGSGYTDPITNITTQYSLPIEIGPANFNAIRTATNNGKIVVETAGNGAFGYSNKGAVLESLFSEFPSLNRNSPNFTDSGAIMVGAGMQDPIYGYGVPTPFTNGGNRVDLQGHGLGVSTTGSSPVEVEDYNIIKHDQYTANFSGTSSAAPIVSGAAALVQSYFRNTFGQPLNSLEMRTLLKNTGHPQPALVGNEQRLIGPLPDVAAALAAKPIKPTIFANGQAGSISIPQGQGSNVNITINLDAGQFKDIPVDWWYMVNWNGAWWYWCSADHAWYPFAVRWFASNLFNVPYNPNDPNFTVYNSPIYGKGTYIFYFGVDTKQDAALFNLDGKIQESAYWTSVTVNVS